AERADAIAAPRKDLVGIGLMTDIPDQPIPWRVEDPVQGHRELDDPETRAEVTARHRYGIDRLLAQLGRKLRKILFRQPAQVLRIANRIEQRRCATRFHGVILSADLGAPGTSKRSLSIARLRTRGIWQH